MRTVYAHDWHQHQYILWFYSRKGAQQLLQFQSLLLQIDIFWQGNGGNTVQANDFEDSVHFCENYGIVLLIVRRYHVELHTAIL